MKLTRIELKKIIYEFNSKSNRLMQVNYEDFLSVLARFINFIENTEIIYTYIKSYEGTQDDLETIFEEIRESFGTKIFNLGDSDEEEVKKVFEILKHCVDVRESGNSSLFYGYSTSTAYQDKIKAFNERVTFVLIRHVETFLTKVGIEMGLDEQVVHQITVENGQVNIANNNATINATINNGIKVDELNEKIKVIEENSKGLSKEDLEVLNEYLEVIKEELSSGKKVRKGLVNTALNGMKVIKGTTEFAAAVTALIQFVASLI